MSKCSKLFLIMAFSMIFVGCSLTNSNQVQSQSCAKYIKTMNYASNYINKEFQEGYFSKKDIVGAKAQLFLIQNNSPTLFSKNINAAQNSYTKNYTLAKNKSCNVKNIPRSALTKLKNTIKALEAKKVQR